MPRQDETKEGLIDLYRRVAAFADQTIEQLPLDAPGRVPWWRPTGGPRPPRRLSSRARVRYDEPHSLCAGPSARASATSGTSRTAGTGHPTHPAPRDTRQAVGYGERLPCSSGLGLLGPVPVN